jgi:hypothetical protein
VKFTAKLKRRYATKRCASVWARDVHDRHLARVERGNTS